MILLRRLFSRSGTVRLTTLESLFTPLRVRPRPLSFFRRPMCPKLLGCAPESTHLIKRRKLSSTSTLAPTSFDAKTVSSSPDMSQQPEFAIELTEGEKRLRQLLLDVAEHVVTSTKSQQESSPVLPLAAGPETKPELRFTGGWVRDKLLGFTSHDIDVGIHNMTGYQFGLKMKEYLAIPGVPEQYKIGATEDDFGGLHKIAANPEKSKHLETVTTKIFDLDIDLVNLRKETYSEESRNPQMEFGTPEQDALRRDATINALFYNLDTCSLEDLTGCGLEDLRAGIIRTPLDPFQTFHDDPLRVLRLIRFASRLGYTIDPKSESCMGNQAIGEALKAKISRERVGVEVEKMLKGEDPHRALALIDRLGLYFTIFTDPKDAGAFDLNLHLWVKVYDQLAHILRSQESPDIRKNEISIKLLAIRNPEEEYLSWVLAALIPWANLSAPNLSHASNKSTAPRIAVVARKGLKASNKVYGVLVGACNYAEEIIALKDEVAKQSRTSGGEYQRDVLGMSIRKWGPSWRSSVVFCLLYETFRSGRDNTQREVDELLERYSSFLRVLEKLDLLEVCSLKPMIDGTQLSKALDERPGPWIKEALEVVMRWQLCNPDRSDEEGAVDSVRCYRAKREDKNGEQN